MKRVQGRHFSTSRTLHHACSLLFFFFFFFFLFFVFPIFFFPVSFGGSCDRWKLRAFSKTKNAYVPDERQQWNCTLFSCAVSVLVLRQRQVVTENLTCQVGWGRKATHHSSILNHGAHVARRAAILGRDDGENSSVHGSLTQLHPEVFFYLAANGILEAWQLSWRPLSRSVFGLLDLGNGQHTAELKRLVCSSGEMTMVMVAVVGLHHVGGGRWSEMGTGRKQHQHVA